MGLGLVLILCLAGEPADVWTGLIEARLTRSVAAAGPAPADSPLALQEYLMTLGQIGDLAAAADVAAYLTHPRMQATALFAYGEMDGAAVAPLLDHFKDIRRENQVLLMEALAKLAPESEWPAVVGLFDQLDLQTQERAMYRLWPIKHPRLVAAAKAAAGGEDVAPGALFYLYRTRTELDPGLLLKILNTDMDGEAAVFAARLRPNAPSPALAARFAALTRSGDWRVRVYALSGLKGLDPDAFRAAGLAALADVNPNVVTNAARLLAGLGDAGIDANLLASKGAFSDWQLKTMASSAKNAAAYHALVADWSQAKDPWHRLRGLALADKAPADKALDLMLVQQFHQGNSVEGELALDALAARKYDKLASLLEHALASGDPIQEAAAVSLLREDRMAGTTLEALKKRTDRIFVEPIFQTAYMGMLKERGDDASYEAELARLAGHEDYAVRLKMLSLKEDPTPEDRALVYRTPWKHVVPEEIKTRAVRLIQGKGGLDWVLTTQKGEVVIGLRGDYAPITSANIAYLSGKGYFDGMPFHRVVPAFVVQGGDSRGNGGGDPGYALPCEINPLRFRRGTVGMALSGKDTGGSQFFICHNDQPHLDGGYTVFGAVTSGMAVVDRLEEGDRILKAQVRER